MADPQNGPARLWLAYCCIHYLMEREALWRAVGLLDGLDDDPSVRGAAAMLRAEALEDLGELTRVEKVHLLETSVTINPGWVRNRQRLAWAYEGVHRFIDALREVRKAISNLQAGVRLDESVERRAFEELITGRAEPQCQEDLEQHAYALEHRIRGDA